MAQTTIIQYADGTIKIDRDGEWFHVDPIRLVGGKSQIMDTLRWEFIGNGVSLDERELQRITSRVMAVMG